MSNAKFRRDFAAILKRAGDKADLVTRASAMAVGASLVQKSPVDTGRFRSNWMYGATTINTTTTTDADKSGSATTGRINAGLMAWKAGQSIHLTNSLPYARRLEYGWSDQAPGGMVRITVVEWRQKVAETAARIRNG